MKATSDFSVSESSNVPGIRTGSALDICTAARPVGFDAAACSREFVQNGGTPVGMAMVLRDGLLRLIRNVELRTSGQSWLKAVV